ncbi:MAG: riboflavin synthase, alpha subunit [Candidatus Angelobacter sp.]|jgi:riboflavin synthase|nr:riboflavin synthase, alpha subunit [Candidatus Angelobacter sp.]
MFTGLIEEVGSVRSVSAQNGTQRIVISAAQVTRELKTGDSVSVSGVCLTALNITPDTFAADLAAETVARTSLSRLASGSLVNLELPAKAGSRLGGHIVQGHVDGVGKLVSLARVHGGNDWELIVELPTGLDRYVVQKGSISIEGISLTVARIQGNRISVAVIPHTYDATNLNSLKRGDPVNIEVDVLAKYAEKIALDKSEDRKLTVERLLREGF